MRHSRPLLRWWWLILLGGLGILALLYVFYGLPRPLPDKPASPYGFPSMQSVELKIGKKGMRELEWRRAAALKMGVLQEDDSSWVKGRLSEGGREWKVRVRLKGDWTDHLEGEKWSFRVEVRDSGAWRGMEAFSLQSPERRGYLDEWLFHRVLAQEGVLTPRYDFIFLRLNGVDLGTYAVEEHFTKQLLESQGRREGPILKFDEDGMWDARVEALRDSSFPYLQIPFQEASTVKPFQQRRTFRDSVLQQAFLLGNRLMRQYRYGLAPPGEIFDLDLVARQYALTDLFSAYHSLIWHNRRFYFNPITSRLEPVVFDGFSGEGRDAYITQPIWGVGVDGWHFEGGYHDLWGDFFFRDSVFVKDYYGYLARYASEGYLDSLFAGVEEDLALREEFLRREYGGYRYSEGVLRERGGGDSWSSSEFSVQRSEWVLMSSENRDQSRELLVWNDG